MLPVAKGLREGLYDSYLDPIDGVEESGVWWSRYPVHARVADSTSPADQRNDTNNSSSNYHSQNNNNSNDYNNNNCNSNSYDNNNTDSEVSMKGYNDSSEGECDSFDHQIRGKWSDGREEEGERESSVYRREGGKWRLSVDAIIWCTGFRYVITFQSSRILLDTFSTITYFMLHQNDC